MNLIRISALVAFFFALGSAQLLKGDNLPLIRVGNVNINKGKVDSLAKLLMDQQFQGQDVPPTVAEQVRFSVVDNLVAQELLKMEATARKIKPQPTQVDSVLKLFKKQFPDEETFRLQLKRSNSTEVEFKERVRSQLQTDMLISQEIPVPAEPGDKDVEAYYTKNKNNKKLFPLNDSVAGSQIFMELKKGESENSVKNKKVMLDGLRAQVLAGKESFAMLAAKYSDDPNARQTGGIIGRFIPQDFGAEWVKAIKPMRVGDVSEVFQSSKGLHLFMLMERNDGKLDSYQFRIENYLRSELEENHMNKVKAFLNKLAKKYPVVYNVPSYKGPNAIGG